MTTEPRRIAVQPNLVRVVDVKLCCRACSAEMLVPEAMVPWWADAHLRPVMLGAVVELVGDRSGTLWWWARKGED